MPMPTVYSNRIFNPESGMFGWQKFINANQDTAQKQAKDYNTALDTKFEQAKNTAGEVQSKLEGEKQDIASVKDTASQYLNTPASDIGTFDQSKLNKLSGVAKSGYKLDADRYKTPIANVAKESADLSAASRISGRMGMKGIATPTMSSFADQVLLQQGGAGQGYESKASELQRTLDLINAGQTEVSDQAGSLQGDVQNTLSTALSKLEPEAKKSAIEAGKAKISDIQNKGLNYQKEFGAMLPTLLRGGVDASQFVKKPDLTEEDYLDYGFNDEMEKVNELRDMLGQSKYEIGDIQDVSLGFDKDAAKSKYNFLKDIELQGRDTANIAAQAALNSANLGWKPPTASAGFASGTIAGKTNKFDENKDYLKAPPTDKDKFNQKNYRFQNLLRGF